MSDPITFELDGTLVEARSDETILDCALRLGMHIPYRCARPDTDLPRPGRCRSCLVEIEGDRLLKAACRERPRPGQKVLTTSEKVEASRRSLAALADEPPARSRRDLSHPAIAVDHDACILCGLCVHACREIACNDVLGIAGRGAAARIVFDADAAMGDSSCVACGQCVEVCPTGALTSRAYGADAAAEPRDRSADRVTAAICPYCCVGCHISVRVRAERIVDVRALDGPTNKGRLCVKGRFGQDFISHQDRLTKPLVREKGAPKSSLGLDWRQAFREASWEEALDAAASGLCRVADERGPSALAFFGSLKTCNEDSYLFQKLARAAFRTNNIDHPTRLCHASSTAALLESVGTGAPTSQIEECLRADVVLVIGANPSTSHPVAGSFLRNAVRRGTRLIVADPRGQPLDRFAEHVLRFNSGTDVVLLNAMIRVVVDEHLVDRSFVAARVDGFDDVADRARHLTVDEAARICGVDAQVVRAAARAYATAPAAMTIWGMGMTQSTHGTDNIRALIALALICGQVGRPGTGLYPIRGHNNAQGAPDSGMLPYFLPDYQPIDDPGVTAKFAASWGEKPPTERGHTMIEAIEAMRLGTVRALYCHGANPAMSMPGLPTVRRALTTLDHLVVQDIFMTETAQFADVVLPAAALLEKEGTLTNIDRRVQLTRAVMQPIGEARPDWWIIQEMARRCGQHWRYAGPAEIFDEMRRLMPSIAGITWDRLSRMGSVQYPCPEEDGPSTPHLFTETFKTANGRARLVATATCQPPAIACPEYPFVMTTGRTLQHHTGPMSRRARLLDALEPTPFVAMAPTDMTRLGVSSGDLVTLRSRHGDITTTVRSDPALPEGLLFAPYCFTEAPANELAGQQMDPDSKTGELKYIAVAVTAAPPLAPSSASAEPLDRPCS